jgi:hypothetical protein
LPERVSADALSLIFFHIYQFPEPRWRIFRLYGLLFSLAHGKAINESLTPRASVSRLRQNVADSDSPHGRVWPNCVRGWPVRGIVANTGCFCVCVMRRRFRICSITTFLDFEIHEHTQKFSWARTQFPPQGALRCRSLATEICRR